MSSLLDPILASPYAPKLLKTLEKRLQEEQEKRKEFYEFVTEDMKAEFINGETVVHSPVKRMHGQATGRLYTALNFYVSLHELGEVHVEKAMIELTRNSYEPDICFFSKKKAKNFTPEQLFFPAPDLVVEVLSKKTEKLDRGIKWEDYAAHGVKEYWIIDPKNHTIEQYIEHDGTYVLEVKVAEGRIHSKAIKGFSITVEAIFDEKENVKAILEWSKK